MVVGGLLGSVWWEDNENIYNDDAEVVNIEGHRGLQCKTLQMPAVAITCHISGIIQDKLTLCGGW